MSKKFIKVSLLQVIFLLISIMSFSIANYVLDGNMIAFVIMMVVLVPQAIFMIIFIVKLIISKKDVSSWVLIFIFSIEVLCILLLAFESFSNLFPIIGYSLLYVLITISWIMLTYQNGTWGKKYQKFKETE